MSQLKVFIASHACATPQNQTVFALAAKERNWNVALCLPRAWRDEYGKLLPATLLDDFDATLVKIPVARNGSIPLHAYIGKLSRILSDFSPDVIYSHNEAYSASTAQWCWTNHRTLKRPFGFFSCQNINKKYPIPFRQSEKWVYGKSDFFFPITEAVDKVHRDKGYKGPSTILPLGYDPTIYRPTQDISHRHLTARDRPIRLAYLGRVVPEKGLGTLVKALSNLRAKSWTLTIAGSGPYEAQLKKLISDGGIANRVEWAGFVDRDKVPKFFESVDALVLPSETQPNWKEQFGRVILEAMACGTPVVGSSSGEIPVLIEETGGGIIFQEKDSDQLALAISRIVDDHNERGEFAVRGAQYVAKHYSLPALATKFADSIERASRN